MIKINFQNFRNCSKAKCGSWCYVDEDASCLETKPSTNSEYHWTCEACNGEIINQFEVMFTFVLYSIFKNKRKRTPSQSGVLGKSDQKITGGIPTTKEQCTTVEGEVKIKELPPQRFIILKPKLGELYREPAKYHLADFFLLLGVVPPNSAIFW